MSLLLPNLLNHAARRSICVALLVPFALVAIAQEPQRITLDDAIRIGLDQNYQMKQWVNNVRLREIDVRSARSAFLPTFNMFTNSGRNYGLSFDTNIGELRTTTNDRLSVGASTGITLFNGFSDFATLKQSQLSLTASDLELERGRQVVVFNVVSQFLVYVERQEQIIVQQENLAAQQQLLTQIEEFVLVGSRPMSDLYQQRAAVASAELSLIDAERLSQIAEANVIQTLQLDPLGRYEFVIPDETVLSLAPVQYDLDQLLLGAMDRRADLRAQEISISASEQGIRRARASKWPSLRLSGSAGTSYNSGSPVVFGDQFENNRYQSVSLSMNIPIFNRLQTHNEVQRAHIAHENARLELDNQRHLVGVEVRSAYLDYVTAEKTLEVTEQQYTFREQALDAARERYNVGAGTLVELTQAQTDFVQASSDRVRAQYTFYVRKRLIDYYTGVLDPGQPILQ